jgi:DNA polymerase-3 subunit gamma/tau
VVRDLMIVTVDPQRAGDGELAEGERERLAALAGRFSREDLMRAFDLLAKAETDIRAAAHPRYHFEMALLRWMHLRKLVPLADLMEQLGGGAVAGTAARIPAYTPAGPKGAPADKPTPTRDARVAPASRVAPGSEARIAPASSKPAPASSRIAPPRDAPAAPASDPRVSAAELKDALLAEIRNAKKILYELSIACAQRIDVTDEAVTFTFGANQNAARGNLEQSRPWVEAAAQRLAGRRMSIVVVQSPTAAAPSSDAAPPSEPKAVAPPAPVDKPKGRDLKAEAMSSSTVQAMLDVFPVEIRDVEEM